MSVAPLGVSRYTVMPIDALDREGAELAAITHGHSLGYMPAAVLTHILHRIVYPERAQTLLQIVCEARDTVRALFAGDKHLDELTARIDLAIRLADNAEPDLANIHRLGEGWVAEETLAIAIYCALRHADDFSAGIIAAVTGNILGALLGYDAIGKAWTRDLELRDVILELADDLNRRPECLQDCRNVDRDWVRKYVQGRAVRTV